MPYSAELVGQFRNSGIAIFELRSILRTCAAWVGRTHGAAMQRGLRESADPAKPTYSLHRGARDFRQLNHMSTGGARP